MHVADSVAVFFFCSWLTMMLINVAADNFCEYILPIALRMLLRMYRFFGVGGMEERISDTSYQMILKNMLLRY